MRILRDPVSATAIAVGSTAAATTATTAVVAASGFGAAATGFSTLAIAGFGFSILSSIASANAAIATGDAEAAFFFAQAQAERVARARELRDAEKARERRLSRTRALLAAGGGDTTIGTGLALLVDQAGEAVTEEQRLRADSIQRESFLTARAGNARSAGRSQAGATLLRGVGSSLTGLARTPRRT